MKRTLAAIVILAAAPPPETVAAPAPPPKGPSLSIVTDRRSYYPYEPIFVEWTITNGRDKTLHYCPPLALRELFFERTDAAGHKTIISPSSFPDFDTPLPLVPLPPHKAHKSWLDLRHWSGFVGVGEFKLRAVLKFGYTCDGPETRVATLRSREVVFRVVRPAGADADAVRLIKGPEPPPPLPRSSDKKAYRKAVEEAAQYEGRRNRWTFPAPIGLQSKVLAETKSARFHAAANFYQGFCLAKPGPKERGYEWENYREGCRCLRACLASKEASPYLKGLAAHHLLLCAAAEKGPAARKEAIRQARALLADYPGTYMAQEAKAILKNLSAGAP